MSEQYNFEKMVEGQDQHYSDKKFLHKLKNFGGGLGYKAVHAAATLYVALRSPDMPKSSKLIVLGALRVLHFTIRFSCRFSPFSRFDG